MVWSLFDLILSNHVTNAQKQQTMPSPQNGSAMKKYVALRVWDSAQGRNSLAALTQQQAPYQRRTLRQGA